MEPSKSRLRLHISRSTLAWLLGVALTIVYFELPSGAEHPHGDSESGTDTEEVPTRPEIWSVSPDEPYPGSTIIISHSPVQSPLVAYADKTALRVLARRPGELLAELPSTLEKGDVKIRIEVQQGAPHAQLKVHSKPFHIRVRLPNYRKIFRSLLGGVALVVLGIRFLSRGVRRSTGLRTARLLTRASRHHGLVLGFGAFLGAVTQSTTGAAGMLAGFASSRVLPVLPAAIAFLGAPLGATIVPLLATGLVEPREGLLAVGVGVLWLGLAAGRHSVALARLVLGAGLVAFGLQVLRPGLEPFLSDSVLWSFAERMSADSLPALMLCSALGSLAVAGLHGPAPLIVLILGVAQATGHWDLRTALALLSGTGLGASIAALMTAPLGPKARTLAQLNLSLGALSTLLSLCSVEVWTRFAELIVGPHVSPLHWTYRLDMSGLGLQLAVAFGLSQLTTAFLLSLVAPRMAHWMEPRHLKRRREDPRRQVDLVELRSTLETTLRSQHAALASIVALALTGARLRGHDAERNLADARRLLDRALPPPLSELPSTQYAAALARAAYATLPLQNAIAFLLRQTERVIDARIANTEGPRDQSVLPGHEEVLLRNLHRLVSEGLHAARVSLLHGDAIDLDCARAREIQINRIEADARSMLLVPKRASGPLANHLHVLQVVDAYEVVGNHIYRLAEALGHGGSAQILLAV